MSEASWDQARLIPTSGTIDIDEQERRAASALLAVIGGIQEFGRAVVQPLAAPVGRIEAFIDVSFSLADRTCYPAGLIRVQHGLRTWIALVEVRTGEAELDTERLDGVLAVAQDRGFDAVLTISNQNSGPDGRPPVTIDPQRRDGLGLHHVSWSRLLADAVALTRLRAVADPEQIWVLSELIRYLEDSRAGTIPAGGVPQIVRGVQMPEPREPVLELDLRGPASRGRQAAVLRTVLIAEQPEQPEPSGAGPTAAEAMEAGPVAAGPVEAEQMEVTLMGADLMEADVRAGELPESMVRPAPALPSRRDLRLVRRLDADDSVEGGAGGGVKNPAGWYQDPEDTGQLRWWDGVAWSERTYPGQTALA